MTAKGSVFDEEKLATSTYVHFFFIPFTEGNEVGNGIGTQVIIIIIMDGDNEER